MIKRVVALLTFTVAAESLSAQVLPSMDSQRAALVARLNTLQNFTAEFKTTIVYTPPGGGDASPPPPDHPSLKIGKPYQGKYVSSEVCKFFHDQIQIDSQTDRETITTMKVINPTIQKRDIFAILSGRAEHLTWSADAPSPMGLIAAKLSKPATMTIDLALGLGLYRVEKWVTPEELSRAELANDNGILRATLIDEGGNTHIWTINPRIGFAIEEYLVLDRDRHVFSRTSNTDFHIYNNLILPRRIHREEIFQDSNGAEHSSFTVDLMVDKYTLNSIADSNSILIVWPKGTTLLESRVSETIDVDRPMAYTDDDIQKHLKDLKYQDETATENAAKRIQKVLGGPSTHP